MRENRQNVLNNRKWLKLDFHISEEKEPTPCDILMSLWFLHVAPNHNLFFICGAQKKKIFVFVHIMKVSAVQNE